MVHGPTYGEHSAYAFPSPCANSLRVICKQRRLKGTPETEEKRAWSSEADNVNETGDGERKDRGMLELWLSKRWRKDICMSAVQAICCGELADITTKVV